MKISVHDVSTESLAIRSSVATSNLSSVDTRVLKAAILLALNDKCCDTVADLRDAILLEMGY